MRPTDRLLQLFHLLVGQVLNIVRGKILLDPGFLRRRRHHEHSFLQNPLHQDLVMRHLGATRRSELSEHGCDAGAELFGRGSSPRACPGREDRNHATIGACDNSVRSGKGEERLELLGDEEMVFDL